MKLIACQTCHAQYDISEMAPESAFDCRCGATLEAVAPVTADAPIRRCTACGAIAKNDDELCDYCGSGIVQTVDRGSLICPECYARNLDDARFCLGCGVAFAPEALTSKVSELRCPCCECWMVSRDVGGLEVCECPKCFGLWAPEDRFDSLVDRATEATLAQAKSDASKVEPRVDGGNPADSSVEYRRCPVCDALMNRNNFQKRSGVIVDRCHSHGTWLDAHELERIAGFVLSGRAARADEIERMLKAQRDERSAQDATTRIRSASMESQTVYGGFGHHQTSHAVRTIFDLLSGLLR